MGMPGIGVMIQALSGNADSVDAYQASLGKNIASASLVDDGLNFVFDDGTKLRVTDEGQSCCESRYMRTDDVLADFAGAKLIGMEIKEAPPMQDECGYEHEVQFLEVQTDRGVFTMASHNEHNGYYGGFAIRCSTPKAES